MGLNLPLFTSMWSGKSSIFGVILGMPEWKNTTVKSNLLHSSRNSESSYHLAGHHIILSHIVLSSHNNLWGRCYCDPHFIDEEAKFQSPDSSLDLYEFRVHTLHHNTVLSQWIWIHSLNIKMIIGATSPLALLLSNFWLFKRIFTKTKVKYKN